MQMIIQHQVLTWGVRNMKKFQLAAVNSPSIEIECGGVFRATPKIKSAKENPNFSITSLFFDVVSVNKQVTAKYVQGVSVFLTPSFSTCQ